MNAMTHMRHFARSASVAIMLAISTVPAQAQYTDTHPQHNPHDPHYRGSHYDAVMDAQRRLRDMHYYHGAIDGIVGPETRGAIIKFQHDHKIAETGYVDESLMSKIRAEQGGH